MRRTLVIALLLAGVVGCNDNKSLGGKVMKQPAPPPPPPPKQTMPIDTVLLETARAEIKGALASSDPVIRANAIEATQNTIGVEGRKSIVDAMSDSDSLVRFAACMAAGSLRLTEAHSRALELTTDRDPAVKIGSRFCLHRLGDVSHSHDFERYASDPDARVRANTAMALGLLGEPTGVRLLIRMRNDSDPTARLQAGDALRRLGSEEGLTILTAGTVSQYGEDQVISVLGLAGPRDSRVSGQISGKLTGDFPEVTLAAARALGMLGSDEGFTVAANGVRSRDARQKALGALALGAIGRSDAQPLLAPLLKDPDPSVRLAAATGMLQLK